MKICVINSGGTISCHGRPLSPMPARDFARAANALLMPALEARLPGIELHFASDLRFSGASGMLDSTDLQPGDCCVMAGHILDNYADFDGFLILHGTDTLDYSGAALPMLLNVADAQGGARAILSKPVILTGSQLPLFRDTPQGLVLNAGSDGFANLAGALACMERRLPEVAAFFDGKLFRASRIVKVSTTSFDAFASPHLPPLARVGLGIAPETPARPAPPAKLALDDPAALALARDQLHAAARGLKAHQVALIAGFPAPEAGLAAMIRAVIATGPRALVLLGHGEGNFPAGPTGVIRQALAEASAQGVQIIAASRVIGGRIGAFHYEAGAWLAGMGAIGAGDMTPMAALAKTAILLAAAEHHGWSADQIGALIGRDLWGEMGADSGDATG